MNLKVLWVDPPRNFRRVVVVYKGQSLLLIKHDVVQGGARALGAPIQGEFVGFTFMGS